MSVPAYPAYKDSGVEWLGAVPAHWGVLAGRRLFAQVREPSQAGDEQLSASQKYGVVPQSLLMQLEDQKVVLALKGLEGFKHVEKDDFVISLRSFQGGIEHSSFSGCVSPAYTVLRPSVAQVPRYYAYLLKARPYVAALQSVTDGIRDGKNISYEQFGQVALPVPELAEQAAIAAFLDRETGKIDALVEEQRRLIALLKEKRQAVISHAVTKGLNPHAPLKPSGIDWPSEIPSEWVILPLTRVVRQFVDYRGATPTKVDEGVPLITATQIKRGRIDHSLDPVYITEQEYETRMTRGFPARGDLLLTTEAPLGEVALVEDEKVAPGQRIILMKVNSDRVTSDFLLTHFQSEFGKMELWMRASGSTASGIRADRLRASLVLVPPLREQETIVAHIQAVTSSFEDVEREANTQIALLQERRAALISAAVTGKIDVRGITGEA